MDEMMHAEVRGKRGNYMVMAHFCLGKKRCVQFLTGKLMYQQLWRSFLYYHN